MQTSRSPHVSVQVEEHLSVYDNSKARRKQSCGRQWNQLSSLQRSLILIIIIFGSLLVIYMWPHYANPPESRKPNQSNEVQNPADANDNRQDVIPQAPPQQPAHDNIAPPPDNEEKQAPPPDDEAQAPPPDNNIADHLDQQNGAKQPLQFSGPGNERQQAVVDAFKHSWSAYRKYAWGHDDLKPVSKSYSDWFGVGLTLIDALDTMYIMGLTEEFRDARSWVAESLSFDINKDVNLFECTIRVLGGLLSAFHLSQDHVFLEKAVDVGERLLGAFSSSSPVPYADVNLQTRRAHAPRWGPDSSTSEVTTIQLEFRDLSHVTGDPKYKAPVDRVTEHVHTLPKKDGLVPIFINANTGNFRSSAPITLGARGDSYYEYLLKMWLQSNRKNHMVKNDYLEAVGGMVKHLRRNSQPSQFTYFGELLGGRFSPKMDHLVCFMGGTLALGSQFGLPHDHLQLGKDITSTCQEMYRTTATGLSPEIIYFNMVPGAASDFIIKPADSHNLQRPETIESLFYLYRITGNKMYQDWGWEIFQSFEKHTKLPEGYTSISNVKSALDPIFRNKMESFWLGETLKYLYLLFSDDQTILPLDQWVFNTEAHPLPVIKS